MPMHTEEWNRLLQILQERSFARKRVVLSSGKESDFFIDCKQSVLLAEGHVLTGQLLYELAFSFEKSVVAVAGVELGGCSLASAVAFASFQRGNPMDAIYVRKQAKQHGSQRLLEGSSHLPPRSPVFVVEDVITTGASTLNAITSLQQGGLTVVGVAALVDRLEGGREAIEKSGVRVQSLYTRAHFMGESE